MNIKKNKLAFIDEDTEAWLISTWEPITNKYFKIEGGIRLYIPESGLIENKSGIHIKPITREEAIFYLEHICPTPRGDYKKALIRCVIPGGAWYFRVLPMTGKILLALTKKVIVQEVIAIKLK